MRHIRMGSWVEFLNWHDACTVVFFLHYREIHVLLGRARHMVISRTYEIWDGLVSPTRQLRCLYLDNCIIMGLRWFLQFWVCPSYPRAAGKTPSLQGTPRPRCFRSILVQAHPDDREIATSLARVSQKVCFNFLGSWIKQSLFVSRIPVVRLNYDTMFANLFSQT